MNDIRIPANVALSGHAEEYIKLFEQNRDMNNKIWDLADKKNELYKCMMSQLGNDETSGYNRKFSYHYPRDQWNKAILAKSIVDEFLELSGQIQEIRHEMDKAQSRLDELEGK